MEVVEFIECKNIEDATKKWNNFASEFIVKPGIATISLYKVYANVKDTVPYQSIN